MHPVSKLKINVLSKIDLKCKDRLDHAKIWDPNYHKIILSIDISRFTYLPFLGIIQHK
jgi:hypothetical protein